MSAPATDSMSSLAREIFERRVGPAQGIEPLPSPRNFVFRVITGTGASYVVKIYAQEDNAVGNWEPAAYHHLQGSPFIRRCIAGGQEQGREFLVVEYVEGVTLLDACARGLEPEQAADVASRIVAFIRRCAVVSTRGSGKLDPALCGTSASWSEALTTYVQLLARRIEGVAADDIRSALEEARARLDAFLRDHRGSLEAIAPVLVPIDLNLTNFLLADDGRVLVLDLGAFWGADPLFAFGEWAAHTYGTPLYAHFCRAWGRLSADELARVRFYALLSGWSVLLFIAGSAPSELPGARPWGNPIPFVDAMRAHAAALAEPAPWPPEQLFEANRALEADWGVKVRAGEHHRTREIADTCARLRSVQTLAGITRVASITGLDSTGIHVYQSIRPAAEPGPGTFTVFSGSGRTPEQAQVAAIAEGIERFCAEYAQYDPGRLRVMSYRSLSAELRVAHPAEFNLPPGAPFSDDDEIEWAPAVEVTSGDRCYVPACAVFFPYVPRVGEAPLRPFTTGLAAGNTCVEALAHGAAEVVERDAALLNIVLRNNPAVELETIDDGAARQAIEQLRGAGLRVIVRYLTAPDVPVPVFSVLAQDLNLSDPLYVSGGYGAHPDKATALLRALNEAAHSRVGTISGAREDLTKYRRSEVAHEAYLKKYAYWFDDRSRTIAYGQIPSRSFPTAAEDLAHMIGALSKAGLHRVLMVDLSRPDLVLRVIKVLVPGVERYTMRRECVGRRARAMYRAMYHKELG